MGRINIDEMKIRLENGESQAALSRHFQVSEAAVCKAVKRLKAAVLPASMEKLTRKEKDFVLNLAEGKTATEAAVVAYDCKDRQVAGALGCRLAKDPDIEAALSDLMSQEGIPRRRRIQRLGDLIESNDLSAVSRGLDMSWKLEGAYAPERVSIEVDHVQLVVDLHKAIEAMKKEQDIIDVSEA